MFLISCHFSFFCFSVPKDLDVKMKAVLLGATFLIVSPKCSLSQCVPVVLIMLLYLQDMMYFEYQKNNNQWFLTMQISYKSSYFSTFLHFIASIFCYCDIAILLILSIWFCFNTSSTYNKIIRQFSESYSLLTLLVFPRKNMLE